jgi:hypothetical protein
MHSGRDFTMLCAQQDTTWFLAAHVAAFTQFAGLVAAVAYDNLSAAVAKVLIGAPRVVRARASLRWWPTTRSRPASVPVRAQPLRRGSRRFVRLPQPHGVRPGAGLPRLLRHLPRHARARRRASAAQAVGHLRPVAPLARLSGGRRRRRPCERQDARSRLSGARGMDPRVWGAGRGTRSARTAGADRRPGGGSPRHLRRVATAGV